MSVLCPVLKCSRKRALLLPTLDNPGSDLAQLKKGTSKVFTNPCPLPSLATQVAVSLPPLPPCSTSRTHMWARPAFLTAAEMAFMAVSMELSSCVSSPVAPFTRRPFSITNRVSVSISVSKGLLSVIFAGYQGSYLLGWTRCSLAVLRSWVAVLF